MTGEKAAVTSAPLRWFWTCPCSIPGCTRICLARSCKGSEQSEQVAWKILSNALNRLVTRPIPIEDANRLTGRHSAHSPNTLPSFCEKTQSGAEHAECETQPQCKARHLPGHVPKTSTMETDMSLFSGFLTDGVNALLNSVGKELAQQYLMASSNSGKF